MLSARVVAGDFTPPTAGAADKLTDAFLKILNMTDPMQLVGLPDDSIWNRARIAEFSQIATACAARGDAVACEILHRAAADLAVMVGSVAKRLGWEAEPFPLAVGGSHMVHSTGLRRGVEKRLRQAGFNLSFVTPVPEPAQGAVRLAVELFQNPGAG